MEVTWRLVSGVIKPVLKADIASLDGIYIPHVLRVREICACGYDYSPVSDRHRMSFSPYFRDRCTDHARRVDDCFSAPLVGYSRAAGMRFPYRGPQFSSIGSHRCVRTSKVQPWVLLPRYETPTLVDETGKGFG